MSLAYSSVIRKMSLAVRPGETLQNVYKSISTLISRAYSTIESFGCRLDLLCGCSVQPLYVMQTLEDTALLGSCNRVKIFVSGLHSRHADCLPAKLCGRNAPTWRKQIVKFWRNCVVRMTKVRDQTAPNVAPITGNAMPLVLTPE